MARKTRSLARGIAHRRMNEEGINRPNAKHKIENRDKVASFFSLNWRDYIFPPVKKSKKHRKKGAQNV